MFQINNAIHSFITVNNELAEIVIGNKCLVLYDTEYTRGIIVKTDSSTDNAEVFLCDIGSTFNYKLSEIRKSSSQQINGDYEAIECSLFGINIEKDWTESESDSIYFDIINKYDSHFIKKINTIQLQTDESYFPNKYSVILYGYSAGSGRIDNLNYVIIKKGLIFQIIFSLYFRYLN